MNKVFEITEDTIIKDGGGYIIKPGDKELNLRIKPRKPEMLVNIISADSKHGFIIWQNEEQQLSVPGFDLSNTKDAYVRFGPRSNVEFICMAEDYICLGNMVGCFETNGEVETPEPDKYFKYYESDESPRYDEEETLLGCNLPRYAKDYCSVIIEDIEGNEFIFSKDELKKEIDSLTTIYKKLKG